MKSRWPLAFAALLIAAPSAVYAQTFQGRILDQEADVPVVTALVTLIDRQGVQVAITAADSLGRYRLEAPRPGVYRLLSQRLGYEDFGTPLLEAQNPDGVYPLDLVMQKSPLPVPGLEVTVSNRQADRQIRLMIGTSIAALRNKPIRYGAIRSHLERGHDLGDLLRWQNLAGLMVFRTTDGPCFSLRKTNCLPVYFNGMRFRQTFVDAVPLDMVHTIVVVAPGESLIYSGGAVLLYSEAWLR